jgi:hypothetical protein
LSFAAETTIGKHLIACINMLNKLIHHADLVINDNNIIDKEKKLLDILK